MKYDIQLLLPSSWQKVVDSFIDDEGTEITHLESHIFNSGSKRDDYSIEIYVGDMPEDTTAEDQAFSNYADLVGFDEDDPEDFNPIQKVKFNGKAAWRFDAYCEDDSPMLLISQEVRKGVLAIICITAPDEESLAETLSLTERSFRVK